MNDLSHVSSTDLTVKLDEKDRELLSSGDHLSTVQAAIYNLARKIKQEELELDELKQAAKMARSTISRLNTERDILERSYYAAIRREKFQVG